MSVLAALSRRFQTLTTDAKPDPPRVIIEGPETNPNLTKVDIKQKSAPVTPEPNRIGALIPTIRQQSSASNATSPQSDIPSMGNFSFSGSSKAEQRPKSPRAKAKPKCKTSPIPNIVNYNIVNSNGVKIGSKTSYICNINQYPSKVPTMAEESFSKPKAKPMPVEIEELSCSTKEITRDDMFLIKTHMGHGWQDMGRRLGLSEGQIQQFEANYKHKGIDEVVYQILLDWKQANTKDAQLGKLISIIWLCQEYDCAERLAASHSAFI